MNSGLFHRFSSTFMTTLERQGKPDKARNLPFATIFEKALLGHKTISTTERHSHHCPESLRDGVNILEFFEIRDYNLATFEKKGSALLDQPFDLMEPARGIEPPTC